MKKTKNELSKGHLKSKQDFDRGDNKMRKATLPLKQKKALSIYDDFDEQEEIEEIIDEVDEELDDNESDSIWDYYDDDDDDN